MLTKMNIRNAGLQRRCGVSALSFVPGINILAGPNGSGKSTVLQAIRRASSGRVTTSHIDLEVADPRFPLPLVFYASEEVVRNGPDTQGSNLLGLQAQVESHGQTLSRHLLNLANLVHPSVVLIDEPETALDAANLEVFYDIVVEKVQEGMQFIIASHHPIVWALASEGAQVCTLGKDRQYVKNTLKLLKAYV